MEWYAITKGNGKSKLVKGTQSEITSEKFGVRILMFLVIIASRECVVFQRYAKHNASTFFQFEEYLLELFFMEPSP